LLFASWIMVIEPLLDSGRWSALALATQVAYPALDVVVVTMVLALLPRVRADLRRMLDTVAMGLVLVALSDSGFMAMLVRTGERGFGWPDLVLQAGLALLAYAAVARSRPVLRDPLSSPAIDRHLGYLPAALALVVAVWHVRGSTVQPEEAALGALLLAVVLTRQALFSRDLAALSDQHHYAAVHDELTGLANRALFFRQLSEHLATPGTGTAAVLLVDLDGFKEVNDTLGHEAGDRVLVQFSQFLTSAAPGVLVARLGGDEFAALLTGSDVEQAAAALGAVVAAGPRAPDHAVPAAVTCSVGLTTTRDGDSAAAVLRRADLAMYDAKRASGSRVSVFTPALAQESDRRHLLAADLARAVERDELRLVYQPLYRLSDGTLAGAEALLRWTHPLFGAVPPDEFIPLAEETGHIHAIGGWVLERAVQQVSAWERAGRHLPRLFVNVSAVQFTDALPAAVADVLDRNLIGPDRLTLEITESQLPGLSVNEPMHRLRAAGVLIALDDFGAGYSSLAQLARLPVDVLKIDRDFIRNLGESAGRSVMDAVINLAKALGLSTVAEGIEDLGQAAEASNAGVDLGQGYLFSRPVDADALELRLPPTEAAPAELALDLPG
jgi:diguanylate cyclase (GGDEF)-like protein